MDIKIIFSIDPCLHNLIKTIDNLIKELETELTAALNFAIKISLFKITS